MAQGCIVKRCPTCGNRAKAPCTHKEARYAIVYRVGKKQRWEMVGPNRHIAERRLAQVMAEIHTGTFHQPKPILFCEFAQKWLREYAQGAVKPSTWETYRILIDHRLNPAFGNLPLSHLTPEEIQGFLASLLRDHKLAPKTANNTLILLKTILKYAKRWSYLRENPAQDIQRYRIEPKEMDFLNPEEIRLFLQNSDEPYRTLFLAALLTGMRRGELLALQWGDIDWNQNRIYVKRSIYWRSKKDKDPNEVSWVFVTPKSRLSRRTIVMSPRLKEGLELHRMTCPVSPHDLVFCTRSGGPLEPDNVVHQEFLPSLARAGLRRIRFHDLRHTFTALLIAQGENVKFIQNQLGHASATTTLDRYGHLMPDAHREVGSKLDHQVFGSSLSPTPTSNPEGYPRFLPVASSEQK